MEGLLSLLLFAGLFYIMMRFGCGAHMIHGHQGGHHGSPRQDQPQASATDPVCGMSVAHDQGYTKMHGGKGYRFCSKQCLERFEAEPGRYLEATKSKETT